MRSNKKVNRRKTGSPKSQSKRATRKSSTPPRIPERDRHDENQIAQPVQVEVKTFVELLNSLLPIKTRPLGDICYRPRRTYPDKQVRELSKITDELGFSVPILLDEADCLVAGDLRYEAAEMAGISEIPVIDANALSAFQKRVYVLSALESCECEALNQFLGEELLDVGKIDPTFAHEIYSLIAGSPPVNGTAPAHCEAISRAGDVWEIGDRYVICATSRGSGGLAVQGVDAAAANPREADLLIRELQHRAERLAVLKGTKLGFTRVAVMRVLEDAGFELSSYSDEDDQVSIDAAPAEEPRDA